MTKFVDTKPQPCPKCRAAGNDRKGNNLTTLPDGKKWCFACQDPKLMGEGFVQGDYYPLDVNKGWLARGLKLETCRKADFRVGQYTGTMTDPQAGKSVKVVDEWVQIATWRNDKNEIIAQKLRNSKKWFKFLGNGKDLDLWGVNDYQPTDKLFIVITGGEIDRLSVMQACGLQYPVLSPPTGEGSAYKAIKKNLKWLMGWKYVVLALDNDEAGIKAMQKAAELFEVDKVRIAKWPAKDPNELLQEGRKEELVRAIWNAQTIEPDHIVTIKDILPQVLEQPQYGLDWPFSTMTKITYGIRFNEITTIVGPTGAGKTEIIKDIVSHCLNHFNVAVFSFEQMPADTVRRYVGAKLGVKLQKPGEKWDAKAIEKTAMEYNEKLFLYDFNGTVSTGDIFKCIRYLAKAKGCKLVIIDNLKSLKIVFKKDEIAEFATSLRSLVKSLGIHVILVSHVNKNQIRSSTHVGFSSKMRQGEKPHEKLSEDFIKKTMNKFQIDWESGRMATESDIEGGNDIAAISDYVFAIARNKQSDNETIRRTITVKPLKCGRIDSEYSATKFDLYREDSGALREVEKSDSKDYTGDKGEEGDY